MMPTMYTKNEVKSKLAQQTLSAVRLAISVKQCIEHTFFPKGEEKNISLLDRAKHEIDGQTTQALNDITLPLKL